MLYFIRRIKMENLLPEFQNFEVYVDSPLAVEATTIFGKNVQDCFDDTALTLVQQGINPIGFARASDGDHQRRVEDDQF